MRAGETEACSSDEKAVGPRVNRSEQQGQVYSPNVWSLELGKGEVGEEGVEGFRSQAETKA